MRPKEQTYRGYPVGGFEEIAIKDSWQAREVELRGRKFPVPLPPAPRAERDEQGNIVTYPGSVAVAREAELGLEQY